MTQKEDKRSKKHNTET